MANEIRTVEIVKGKVMLCHIIDPKTDRSTGKKIEVRIGKVLHDHETLNVVSAVVIPLDSRIRPRSVKAKWLEEKT